MSRRPKIVGDEARDFIPRFSLSDRDSSQANPRLIATFPTRPSAGPHGAQARPDSNLVPASRVETLPFFYRRPATSPRACIPVMLPRVQAVSVRPAKRVRRPDRRDRGTLSSPRSTANFRHSLTTSWLVARAPANRGWLDSECAVPMP